METECFQGQGHETLDTIGKLFTKSITLRIPVESIDGQLVEGLNALVSNNKERAQIGALFADDERCRQRS